MSDIIFSMTYELTVVASCKLDSDLSFSKVEKVLKGVNACDIAVERLGRKMLAYPIVKQTEGEYFVFNFEAEGEAVKKISEALRLEQEAILRYLIIKRTEGTKKPQVQEVSKIPSVSQIQDEQVSRVIKGKTEKKMAKVTVKTITKSKVPAKGGSAYGGKVKSQSQERVKKGKK